MSDLVVKVTEDNFHLEVLESKTPVLVDFWAEWCGPCVALAPTLEQIAQERKGKVKICKVNTEENPKLAAQYNIRSIPFMAIMKDGQKVGELVGNMPKQAILKKLDEFV